MATVEDLKQAYLQTWGYIPPRIDNWTGTVSDADVRNVLGATGTIQASTAETETTSTLPVVQTPMPPTGTVTAGLAPSAPTLTPVSASEVTVPLWVQGKAGLEQAWIDEWIATGDTMLAREAVRAHPSYETYYAGNRRDDGTVRVTEEQHLSLLEGYRDALLSVGLNPSIFEDNFGTLVSNNVDVTEFVDRIEAVRAGIIDRAPAVAQYYTDNYGIEMTPEAVYASLLDPTVAEGIIGRTIAISQIGAAASEHGFGIGLLAAEALVNRDVDIFTARRFFGEAEAMVPVLGTLAARHNDPDDDFDLGEFTQAEIMNDPEQRRRIRRLLAQERSSFVQGSGQAGAILQSDTGLTGLASR